MHIFLKTIHSYNFSLIFKNDLLTKLVFLLYIGLKYFLNTLNILNIFILNKKKHRNTILEEDKDAKFFCSSKIYTFP